MQPLASASPETPDGSAWASPHLSLEVSHLVDGFITIRRNGGRPLLKGRQVGNLKEHGQNEKMSQQQASNISAVSDLSRGIPLFPSGSCSVKNDSPCSESYGLRLSIM